MKNRLVKILIGISVFLLLLFAYLLYLSPQKTEAHFDKNGKVLPNSIAEIRNVPINGVNQRLLIRGEDKNNPVLLHCHGGPGTPEQVFLKHFGVYLEDVFTVCYWEQRGAGGSFSDNIPVSSMTLDQIAKDGIELSKYLKQEFQKEKIYVQGHSWGTAVASTMVHQAPELYQAYIGIGQIANTKLSEQRSYDFARAAAKKAGDLASVKKLDKIGRPPYAKPEDWLKNVMPERQIMRQYEGPVGKKSISIADIYKAFIFYPEYSIQDKLNTLKGDAFSMQNLWTQEVVPINFFETIRTQQVPVYIFQGKFDKHTVSSVSKEYFDILEAPEKRYFEFDNSGHDPHIDEFEKYKNLIIKEVLKK